jgi:hypothetical protein
VGIVEGLAAFSLELDQPGIYHITLRMGDEILATADFALIDPIELDPSETGPLSETDPPA